MASLQQFKNAADAAGFVLTSCVHESASHHLVLDYPQAFKEGQEPFWRVHVDQAKVPHVTHVIGHDTASQRVSLKNAIDFMERVAAQNPK